MLRIKIEWNHVSPFLKIMFGFIIVEDIEITYELGHKKMFSCQIESINGSLIYKEISLGKDVPTELFNKLKPLMDAMVRSYIKGVNLETIDHQWITDDIKCLQQLS